MKNRKIIFITTSLLFSILFYNQSAGLNYLLFSVLIVTTSVILKPKLLKHLNWCLIAIGTLFSGFFVMYLGNSFAIILNIISLLLISSLFFKSEASLPMSILHSTISHICSPIFMFFTTQKTNQIHEKRHMKKDRICKKIILGFIIIIISILFLQFYREMNPVFNDLTKNMFDFISWGIIFFFIFSLLLLFPFFYNQRILNQLFIKDRRAGKTLISENLQQYDKTKVGILLGFKNEQITGIILLSLLNLMLFFVNTLDFNVLFLQGVLPKGVTFSEYVHDGITILIFSIIFSISIILFLFRGHNNFGNSSIPLKILTYLWIIQNIIVVLFTMYKNGMYVTIYGLTFKRIGVFYYLLLSIIGLLVTTFKIYLKKQNWYLFKTNAIIFYSILCISSSINWEVFVTRYNLETGKTKGLEYLYTLGDSNIPTLHSMHIFPRDSNNNIGYDYYKINTFLSTYANDYSTWQSWCYDNYRIKEYILKNIITSENKQKIKIIQTIK